MALLPTDTKHILIVPAAMWGHFRPLLHLGINLLTLHPDLRATFLITPSIAPRLEKDLEQLVADLTIGTTPVAERLQTIICVPKGSDASREFKAEDMGKEVVEFASVMPEIISGLYDANYNSNGTLNKFEGLPPSLVLYDMFQTFVPDIMVSTLESLNITVPPLVMFAPCSPASVYHLFGPEEKGGSFARLTRLAEEDIAMGVDPIEAYAKYAFRGTGQVLPLPGLPAKFDYEWWPHKDTVPISGHVVSACIPALKAFLHKNTVAIAIAFAGELESEAVSALEEVFSDKTIYTVGPQFPEEMWEGDFSVKAGSDDDKRVIAFLDQMKEKHGSNSVCYIRYRLLTLAWPSTNAPSPSFGSLFFPIFRPELIRYILSTLQETGVPFVFAYASGIAPVPIELIEEFAGLEDACFVKFAPQWAVLKHPATGFFLTHCGSNSTHETITAKVPIVSMPFAADQGQIASLLTDVLHVGIDLKQTKTFINPPFNKLYDGTVIEGTESAIKDEMRTVWKRMKGKEGEEMRVRMGEVKERLRKSFNDGRGKQDMIKLGECRL
ncbi:hypothetical protein L198_01128 [Cryptococcus wingfieldii CBS 7118]|uniref:UDP-glycosyltransferases domain-containing protein n=1 Tax=Cryptococcus wingfieldii CBS 7118 TaxID=1295528 RepID=A0A1E3K3E0_9TREE|nr:hypothetical protein L198_01128 [Cryptococcus wingfieldii CBS 7118]ODO07549.1 hypothetical protein L198_01128 [Cryptococcus wingfieldii CBS 7118]